jgi:hypothetical protein
MARIPVPSLKDTKINKYPSDVIFQDGREASKNAFSNARPNPRIIIGTSHLGKSFESLKDSNSEGLHNENNNRKKRTTAC